MGRDVCGHAYRDAAASVNQQVGIAGGEHRGLHKGFIEIGHEIHGVLSNIRHHFGAQLGKAGFRIPHGSGAVPIDGAEVALSLHQHIAGVEFLGQAHHRVIDGAVSMGVIFAQHIAHDAGALMEGLIRAEALLVHGIKDAPMHGLQPVPHIGKGAVDNNRHSIGDERFLHLLLNIEGAYAGIFFGFLGHSSVTSSFLPRKHPGRLCACSFFTVRLPGVMFKGLSPCARPRRFGWLSP
ncbi:hypothetical protein SDC9_159343 [bioreactor metagenome]|uniref:Uncharacterized protein n=1 Tax=bioreactor metagenome TaxID=1076179 RepID=A0A645FIG5_9ZZZZ